MCILKGILKVGVCVCVRTQRNTETILLFQTTFHYLRLGEAVLQPDMLRP